MLVIERFTEHPVLSVIVAKNRTTVDHSPIFVALYDFAKNADA